MADPLDNTISTPKSIRIKINGIIQYFFLVRKKSQRSFKNSISQFF